MEMESLKAKIKQKALVYLNESDADEEQLEFFPQTIVDYVCEYAIGLCNFPSSYKDDAIVKALSKCESALAMACVDVYLKIGNEGQTQYSSNGIQRVFRSDWINASLLEQLPNYVGILQ